MSRIPTCLTHDCTNVGVFGIPMADRGGRLGYYCARCARERGYTEENGIWVGTEKVNENTFSWENETAFSTQKGRAELLHFGFIPTHDATVNVEYKSPIYKGLNAVSKQLVSIEKLIVDGDIRIDHRCGSHFHVGHATHINATTMRYIRRFNGSLFVPLSNAIMADVEKSARFFGRRPNTWAEPVRFSDPSGDYDGYRMKHEAMFNLQHDKTIEFRQAKFVSARQYMAVAKFAKDVTNCIVENFVKHFNDTDFDRRRYPDAKAYRKHKADVTANKMVKLYEKYTANI